MDGKLIVREGGREKIHEICDDLLVIGRGPEVDLHLRDSSVAVAHAEIRRTPRGFRVVDMETAAGTSVNGKTVNQHMLKNGDTIQIGGVQLTFLGDSAKPAEAPRHQSHQIPPRLPKRQDGAPERFYRHETPRVRRRSNSAVVAFICVVIIAVAITLALLNKSSYRTESQERIDDINDLLKENTVSGARRAREMLKAIPRTAIDSEDREYLRLKITKALSALETDERLNKQKQRYGFIVRTYQSGSQGVEWLRRNAREFEAEWPGSEYAVQLRDFVRKASSGSPATERKWRETRDRINTSVRTSSYKTAFRLLRSLKADADIRAAFGERLAVLESGTRTRFKRFFEEAVRRALEAHAEGDKTTARKLLEMLADVGEEPFAGKAREHLSRLK